MGDREIRERGGREGGGREAGREAGRREGGRGGGNFKLCLRTPGTSNSCSDWSAQ